jgi:hypothetical protein
VAIVGAGVAGLFLGMMLDYLNDHIPEFNVGYEIFEANDPSRVGGRLFTYNFKPDPPQNPQGPHDYYDVGGMRFPQNPIMQRVFELFDWLEMPMGPLKKDMDNGSLVPYSMINPTEEHQIYNTIIILQLLYSCLNVKTILMLKISVMILDIFMGMMVDVVIKVIFIMEELYLINS